MLWLEVEKIRLQADGGEVAFDKILAEYRRPTQQHTGTLGSSVPIIAVRSDPKRATIMTLLYPEMLRRWKKGGGREV